MAVGVETPRDPYVGNGTTTVFPLHFSYTEPIDVEVYLDDVLQEAGVTVNESDVTFASAPATGVKITLLRNTPLDQPIPFEDPQRTTLAEVERVSDRSVRMLQEREDKFNRVPLFPPSSTKASRANATLGFDAQGNPQTRTPQQEVSFLGIGGQVQIATDAATRASQAVQSIPALLPAVAFNFSTQPSGFNFTS